MEEKDLKKLSPSEERYRSIFENMRSGVAYQKILSDKKGEPVDFVFLEINSAFEKIMRTDRNNIIGRKFSEVMPAVKDSMFNWTAFYHTLATSGKEIKFEQFLKDVGRWYAVSAYSIKEGHFITIYDDITDRKNIEESLRQAYATLKTAQAQLIQTEKMEVVGRLSAGITHEIKNPLAIIQQGVDYLRKKINKRSKNVSFAISSIESATKRAGEIVRSLLAFSRSSDMTMSPENLNAVIESALLLVKNDVDRNNIKVRKSFDKRIPKVNLEKFQIEQVLINIFINSIQAMEKNGELKITTFTRDGADGKKSVVVTSEDTGPGIHKDIIDKIFDPFFTTKEVGRGTGLGLYVVNNIIKAHNANIKIDNRKDRKGACATIIFDAIS
jgi:PAS domain S-box-containing protein